MCLRAVSEAVYPDTLSFGVWDERLIKKSRRALLGDQTEDFPWNRLIIYSITGIEADKACSVMDKVVIPSDLIEVLQKTTFNGESVVLTKNSLVSQAVKVEPAGWFTPMTLACILLLLAFISCFWMQGPLSIFLLVLQSVLGIALTYLVVFSALPNTSFSWLIIPFNPLPLFLWHWRKWWLVPFAVICIGWSVVMLTRIGNPLVDNAFIVFVLALAVNYMGQWNQLRKQIK
jgi:hypothetical protein